VAVTRIGRVVAGPAKVTLLGAPREALASDACGFDHFR